MTSFLAGLMAIFIIANMFSPLLFVFEVVFIRFMLRLERKHLFTRWQRAKWEWLIDDDEIGVMVFFDFAFGIIGLFLMAWLVSVGYFLWLLLLAIVVLGVRAYVGHNKELAHKLKEQF